MTASTLVRDARRASRLTQAELAERLGITQSALAQLERAGANPTVDRLADVVRASGHQLVLSVKRQRPAIDETLLARNLRMTPAERLSAFETAHHELQELRRLMPDAG